MRQSLTQALHHTRHRKTFGFLNRAAADENVLADLIIEYEAALMMGFRIARAYDEASQNEEALFARLSVVVGKYWSNKRCSMFVNEAMGALEEQAMSKSLFCSGFTERLRSTEYGKDLGMLFVLMF